MLITIDGTAGAGKTTVGAELSSRLNFYFLSTGLLYRVMAVLIDHRMDYTDEDSIENFLKESFITMDVSDGGHKIAVFLGNDCEMYHKDSHLLRDPRTSEIASVTSGYKCVRQALLEVQRDIASCYDLVADGRDLGTVVFPDADYKWYLDASIEVRAKRRSSTEEEYKRMVEQMNTRDRREKNRSISPLKPAKDAYCVDTSHISINDLLSIMLSKMDMSDIA